MEKGTFSRDDVAKYQQENFVSLALDFDKEQDLVEKYEVEKIPATLIVDAGGEVISRIAAQRPTRYLSGLQATLSTWPEIQVLSAKVKETPYDGPRRKRLAEMYLKIGALEKARAEFEEASKVYESDPESLSPILVELAYLGLDLQAPTDELVELVARIRKSDPDGRYKAIDNALHVEAYIQSWDGKWQETSDLLQRIVREHPDTDRGEEILSWAARIELNVLDNKPGALRLLKLFLERYPDSELREQIEHALQHATGEHADH